LDHTVYSTTSNAVASMKNTLLGTRSGIHDTCTATRLPKMTNTTRMYGAILLPYSLPDLV